MRQSGACSLSPVFGGEGRGEGASCRPRLIVARERALHGGYRIGRVATLGSGVPCARDGQSMTKILDPSGFQNALQFVMRPVEGNPIWTFLERIAPCSLEQEFEDFDGDPAEVTLHFEYYSDGLTLICPQRGEVLNAIFFYVMGAECSDTKFENYQPFTATLPHPLEAHLTREQIVERLGVPEKVGGNFTLKVTGYQRPWIKYYPRKDVQMMIEFEGERIWRVNVGEAFR